MNILIRSLPNGKILVIDRDSQEEKMILNPSQVPTVVNQLLVQEIAEEKEKQSKIDKLKQKIDNKTNV